MRTVSSVSFDMDESELGSAEASAVYSGAHTNSVYMVRGSDVRSLPPAEDSNRRYLSLGIHEIHETKNQAAVENLCNNKAGGKQAQRPYKRDAINKAMAAALKKGRDRRDVILSSLKLMGITAFIIDARHATTTPEIMEHVRRVITFVSAENRTFAPTTFQRCLLYQDKDGLLYNLTLPKYSAGLASKWQEYVDSFSAFRATLAVALLMRSMPCSQQGEMLGHLKPAYLALIVGIVLAEEVGLSWANVVMMVQACPSISAYSITKDSGSDWIKKLIVLMLAVAGAATGNTQIFFCMAGILLTCAVLLANLGARAWYFFQWQPLHYNGPLSSVLAYMTAVLVGFFVPFLGHRTASAGAKPAIESILRLAVLAAIAFIITDFETVQTFLIVGKEPCDQTAVNTFVGIWFSLSLIASVYIAAQVKPILDYPDEEPLLEENHESPVGYVVPNLPNFPIDPCSGKRGIRRIPLRVEIAIGVLLSALVGVGIVSLAYTDWGKTAEKGISDAISFF